MATSTSLPPSRTCLTARRGIWRHSNSRLVTTATVHYVHCTRPCVTFTLRARDRTGPEPMHPADTMVDHNLCCKHQKPVCEDIAGLTSSFVVLFPWTSQSSYFPSQRLLRRSYGRVYGRISCPRRTAALSSHPTGTKLADAFEITYRGRG